MMGSFTDKHITPIHVTEFNYSGLSGNLPIHWFHDKHVGCLKVTFKEKTAYGEPRLANHTGPCDLRSYVQTVIKMGLSHNKSVIPKEHPPKFYCPNLSAIEFGTFPKWGMCKCLANAT